MFQLELLLQMLSREVDHCPKLHRWACHDLVAHSTGEVASLDQLRLVQAMRQQRHQPTLLGRNHMKTEIHFQDTGQQRLLRMHLRGVSHAQCHLI
jgi:hypothetical protein